MAYISWFSDFDFLEHFLEHYIVDSHHIMDMIQSDIAKSDIANDLILFKGHCDLYFMVH